MMDTLTNRNAARWPYILAAVATSTGTGYYAHEQVVDHLRERIADVRSSMTAQGELARNRYEDLMQHCRTDAK